MALIFQIISWLILTTQFIYSCINWEEVEGDERAWRYAFKTEVFHLNLLRPNDHITGLLRVRQDAKSCHGECFPYLDMIAKTAHPSPNYPNSNPHFKCIYHSIVEWGRPWMCSSARWYLATPIHILLSKVWKENFSPSFHPTPLRLLEVPTLSKPYSSLEKLCTLDVRKVLPLTPYSPSQFHLRLPQFLPLLFYAISSTMSCYSMWTDN